MTVFGNEKLGDCFVLLFDALDLYMQLFDSYGFYSVFITVQLILMPQTLVGFLDDFFTTVVW